MAPTAAPVADAGGEAFSGTNVQELGVDEPDLVKTDGARVFVLAGARLLAYDVTADTPRLLGSLALAGAPQHLLLRGERLLVIGSASQQGAGGGDVPVGGPVTSLALPYGGASRTQLTEVNVRDPSAMTVSRTLGVDGQYVSGRLTGGTARVVLTTPPDVAEADQGTGAFIPETTLRSNISRRTFRRPLVGCGAVRRPDAYAGLDLLSVMTIDLDRGLYSVDRDAVLAGAQVVYASPTGLYVASQRYVPSLDRPQDGGRKGRVDHHPLAPRSLAGRRAKGQGGLRHLAPFDPRPARPGRDPAVAGCRPGCARLGMADDPHHPMSATQPRQHLHRIADPHHQRRMVSRAQHAPSTHLTLPTLFAV